MRFEDFIIFRPEALKNCPQCLYSLQETKRGRARSLAENEWEARTTACWRVYATGQRAIQTKNRQETDEECLNRELSAQRSHHRVSISTKSNKRETELRRQPVNDQKRLSKEKEEMRYDGRFAVRSVEVLIIISCQRKH